MIRQGLQDYEQVLTEAVASLVLRDDRPDLFEVILNNSHTKFNILAETTEFDQSQGQNRILINRICGSHEFLSKFETSQLDKQVNMNDD